MTEKDQKDLGYIVQQNGALHTLEILACWIKGKAIDNPELAAKIERLIDDEVFSKKPDFAGAVNL